MPLTDQSDWRGPGHSNMNINEPEAQNRFGRLMDQVYMLYHVHPSNLEHIGLTDAEKTEMVYYDAMGRNLSYVLDHTAGGQKLKKVILHTTNTSNGLPRGGITYVSSPQMSNVSFVLWMLLFIALSGACFWVFMLGEI